jgi:hypothetical protein
MHCASWLLAAKPFLSTVCLAVGEFVLKFASRLAGLIAGSGAKPITVLDLRHNFEKLQPGGESAAEPVATPEAHPEEVKQGSADVTTRSKNVSVQEITAAIYPT